MTFRRYLSGHTSQPGNRGSLIARDWSVGAPDRHRHTFGGRSALPKAVVFGVLPQLEAIAVSSDRCRVFLLHAAEIIVTGKRTPVWCRHL